jgi:CRP/FNR family transcriptional regulator
VEYKAEIDPASYFPFWTALTALQKDRVKNNISRRFYPEGTLLHRGGEDCVGLFLVESGRLRIYTISESGKEMTLYRLLDRDICLLSASCMLKGIQFDVMVSAEADTRVLVVAPSVYKPLMEESPAVANFTNLLMASHFSEVMWRMEQIQSKKLDSQLAALLLEERILQGTDKLTVTHAMLGNHLGSPREVITRLLKFLQAEGLVSLERGSITLIDPAGLERLAEESL